MGVYNHFQSKFGIIEALFMQGFVRLGEAIAATRDIEDPYEALREGGRRYRTLALAHPMVYRIMFLRSVPGFEPSDQALEVASEAFGVLISSVQRAIAAGVLTEGRPSDMAQVIWASIHGWVSLELMGMGFVEDQDEGFNQVCQTILRGLRP
jgi:AcrR family transcriptional regulator